ncbi:unnamed protein product [Hyaloperonospora brassicae]|nr:unnamed protein product [Hyaloperonospora brassicae]
MENLARNLSKGLLNLIAGLDEVVAERNSLNGVSSDVLPPVLPHELVTLNGRDFTAIVRAQRERLAARWVPISAEATMDYIETEFRDLKNAYRNETPLRNALDGTFPGTSSVESDFSILKWEIDIHRMSLTDFSLEGVMHARQFKLLQKLTF